MATDKKKDSKALYEVISQRRRMLGVPGWFGKARQDRAQDTGVDVSSADPEMVGPDATQETASLNRPAAGSLRPDAAREPVFDYTDGRLRVSFNRVSTTVAIVGLMLLLTASFLIGKRSGRLAAGGDVRVETPREIGPESVKLTPAAIVPDHEPPAIADGRKKGMYYLVIQDGISTEGQAKDIQTFLRGKGVQASIDRGLTNKWMVLDDVSFGKKDAPEIADRKNKIEQMGKEYLKKTHAYGFRQPYLRLED